jgi:hypothetical protein
MRGNSRGFHEACSRTSIRIIRQQNAKAIVLSVGGTKSWNRNMQMSQMLRGSAMAMALLLPVGSAYAQGHDRPDAAPPEWPAGEPLDLTTPEPDADKPKGSNPLAGKPSAPSWDSKVGIDYRKPSIPGASFQPEQLTAGAIPDQSTGVAWATVTAPGLANSFGWDQTIETRLDPGQEGKLGTTLQRSVPVDDNVSMTLQNGMSVTRGAGHADGWATSQALRFDIAPTDTSVSIGADLSSTDDKWLRTLSAEQKLFGGPFSVTGSVSETPGGDISKSLRAGFKRQW